MCIRDRATALYQFDGLGRVPVTEATAGNIIAMSGIGEITIGDTICAVSYTHLDVYKRQVPRCS